MRFTKDAREMSILILMFDMMCLVNAGQQILSKKFIEFIPESLQRGREITVHWDYKYGPSSLLGPVVPWNQFIETSCHLGPVVLWDQ